MTQDVVGRIVPVAVAFLVAMIAVRLVERSARPLGLVDLPNARSSHVVARPRGGGIGVLAGLAAGLAVAAAAGLEWHTSIVACLVATVIVAGVGFVDDLKSISVGPRLVAQCVAASGLVWFAGGLARLPLPAPFDVALGSAGAAVAVVWLVGVTNFFNFMDGADGLAGGQAAITLSLLGYVLVSHTSGTLAWVGAAASLAFLTRNWAPARIFLGDVGSGCLGFLIAALPFTASEPERGRLILLVATSTALFLLDPFVTLVRRTTQGKPIGEAHREHAYQRLFHPHESHGPVVGALLAAGVLLSFLALATYTRPSLSWWVVGAMGLVFTAEWRIAALREPRPPVRS